MFNWLLAASSNLVIFCVLTCPQIYGMSPAPWLTSLRPNQVGELISKNSEIHALLWSALAGWTPLYRFRGGRPDIFVPSANFSPSLWCAGSRVRISSEVSSRRIIHSSEPHLPAFDTVILLWCHIVRCLNAVCTCSNI